MTSDEAMIKRFGFESHLNEQFITLKPYDGNYSIFVLMATESRTKNEGTFC